MKAPRESDILRQCLDYLTLRGITAWRSNNTGVYDAGRRCFRSFRGLRGVSDILGVLAPGGRLLAVEVKRPGGRVSPYQSAFLDAVNAAGGLGVVVRSLDDLQQALEMEGVR